MLGTYFLDDADGGVEHDHDQDDRQVGQVAEACGEYRGGEEEQDHRIPQLHQYAAPG